MCEYCEELESIREERGFDISISKYTDSSFIEIDCPYNFIAFEINFCPMCGRKLSDD